MPSHIKYVDIHCGGSTSKLIKFLLFAFILEAIMSSDLRVMKFSDYLVDNYIDNDAAFPPILYGLIKVQI